MPLRTHLQPYTASSLPSSLKLYFHDCGENKSGASPCSTDTVPSAKTQLQPKPWEHGASHSSIPLSPFSREGRAGTAGTSHGAPSTKWTRTELQRAWRRTAQMLPCYRCISVQRDCAHFWAPYGKKAEMLKVSLASVPQEQTDPRGTQVDRYECENAAQP